MTANLLQRRTVMRKGFLLALWTVLGIGAAVPSSAIPFTIKITADNFYGVYTGTASGVTTLHFSGAWSTVTTQTVTPATTDNYLYVVAWDDNYSLQGLVATVSAGSGYVTTGSGLWTVCPTSTSVTTFPTPASLSSKIAACNNSGGWASTSIGPNDGWASSAPYYLWSNLPQIDDTAAWVWYDKPSAPCVGTVTPPFLQGSCNPGEYLIFRISLDAIAQCPPPIPDFNINWTAGYGVLAADGTNSQYEQNYFWSIQESDQWWGTYGTEVMQWFSGQAGPFDLKSFYEASGQHLKCGTYYRVKLAVANRCVSWRDTIRLVKLECCPGEVISPQ
jgi:hypothetical protein